MKSFIIVVVVTTNACQRLCDASSVLVGVCVLVSPGFNHYCTFVNIIVIFTSAVIFSCM